MRTPEEEHSWILPSFGQRYILLYILLERAIVLLPVRSVPKLFGMALFLREFRLHFNHEFVQLLDFIPNSAAELNHFMTQLGASVPVIILQNTHWIFSFIYI